VSYHVLNVHAPTENKIDGVKESFYKELECVFNEFPKYHEHFGRRFQCQIGMEDIFKPTVRNESLHEISNDNGVRVLNFATSQNHS
jgi:hypothetical protein